MMTKKVRDQHFIAKMEHLPERARCLLVGVTGGIASGKSTVSFMLEEMGIPLIDYDVLARQVVEPGQPAWEAIVGYFGTDILLADGWIDRKKLSKIVFRNIEKRKKLESITHPFIHNEFFRQLAELTSERSDSIVQVSIPLMIERNLQVMFHKIVLVYTSEHVQIERLVARDKITVADARAVLAAQLPISEKVPYADFVIYNEGQLEETKRQVVDLYEQLKEIQKNRSVEN